VRRFRTDKGVTLSTNHPLATAALEHLGKSWPSSVGFSELLAFIGVSQPTQANDLGGFLLNAAAGRVIQFSVHSPPVAVTAGDFPRASRLARWQAARGEMVTTLTGASVKLEGAIARELLMLLDGTHGRAALADQLAESVLTGRIAFEPARGVSRVEVRTVLRKGLDTQLERLAKLGLIERHA
jgi:hypothetical protein